MKECAYSLGERDGCEYNAICLRRRRLRCRCNSYIPAVRQFCRQFDFDLVVRAHQVVENGYEFLDGSRRLVTVFSAPNYCGEFNNAGALMIVNENLMCSFQVLKPSVRVEDRIALKSPAAKTGRLSSAF